MQVNDLHYLDDDFLPPYLSLLLSESVLVASKTEPEFKTIQPPHTVHWQKWYISILDIKSYKMMLYIYKDINITFFKNGCLEIQQLVD